MNTLKCLHSSSPLLFLKKKKKKKQAEDSDLLASTATTKTLHFKKKQEKKKKRSLVEQFRVTATQQKKRVQLCLSRERKVRCNTHFRRRLRDDEIILGF